MASFRAELNIRSIQVRTSPSQVQLADIINQNIVKNTPSTTNKLIESIKKESRFCIIECSVFIEERTSEVIGRLLDIDWKKSETLGYGSSNIGFDNKIKLIQDLKGVNKLIRQKFQCFMAIRNKFAHISEIDSFKNYFDNIKSSKDRRKELIKWFPDLKWETEDIESVFKFAYLCLTLELNRELFNIEKNHVYQKGKQEGTIMAYKKFMEETESKLQELDNGNEIMENIIANVKK